MSGEITMDEDIKTQVLQVRNSGLTNMMDVAAVKVIAEYLELDELAAYLAQGNVNEYIHFILTCNT